MVIIFIDIDDWDAELISDDKNGCFQLIGDIFGDEDRILTSKCVVEGCESVLKFILLEGIKSLTEREQRILYLRYCLDGKGIVRSLEDVGKEFDLTRERIR